MGFVPALFLGNDLSWNVHANLPYGPRMRTVTLG
jgi:hypothetical protein